MEKYYLTVTVGNGQPDKREVTREDFIAAERAAGFRPKLSSSHPNYMTTLATGGFSQTQNGCALRGTIEWEDDE